MYRSDSDTADEGIKYPTLFDMIWISIFLIFLFFKGIAGR